MKNLYYGDILKCIDERTKISEEKGYLVLGGAYLIEISDGKFVLLEELLNNKKTKQVFNLYSFKKGEYYVDPWSLIKVNDIMVEKKGRKLK